MNLDRYRDVSWSEGVRDCWWLVRDFYLHELGIELPRVCVNSASPFVARRELKNNPVRKLFDPIDRPVPGCVVELTQLSEADHVGVYLEVGGLPWVLHNERGAGVCVTSLDEMWMNYKLKGYYQYVG